MISNQLDTKHEIYKNIEKYNLNMVIDIHCIKFINIHYIISSTHNIQRHPCHIKIYTQSKCYMIFCTKWICPSSVPSMAILVLFNWPITFKNWPTDFVKGCKKDGLFCFVLFVCLFVCFFVSCQLSQFSFLKLPFWVQYLSQICETI